MAYKSAIGIVILTLISTTLKGVSSEGLLYPTESETRDVRSLDGVWNFLKSDQFDKDEGIRHKWFKKDLREVADTIPMPVPSSYNDITQDGNLRDHVGTVWYQRQFFVPSSWQKDQLVWLRFGSAHYKAIVWVNENQVLKHSFGHLPFEADISSQLKFGQQNRISVQLDNTLSYFTIPQGTVVTNQTDAGRRMFQTYTFDFFNYAGIHRSVLLYTTPKIAFIKNLEIKADVSGKTGILTYKVVTNSSTDDHVSAAIYVIDRNGTTMAKTEASSVNQEGKISIENVNLWWPYLMHPEPGYLYTLEVRLSVPTQKDVDVYRTKFGFRNLSWNSTQFLINGKPIYFRGFGRHEDSDIRGKGFDNAVMVKDFNLLKWMGANAYRTSHYPYSEESMQFADEHGIMIIDECPIINTKQFLDSLLANHKQAIKEMIDRDRNHPSVIMWSVANEAKTWLRDSEQYFKEIAEFTKSQDLSRPITQALFLPQTPPKSDYAGKYMDIISFNKYNGWYKNPGRLDVIIEGVVEEATEWHKCHDKPVLILEYGADTMEGLHLEPSFIWSEEYQNELFSKHYQAFDQLRDEKFFIGEFVWNLVDFKTAQDIRRVGGNKKGIFTRNRQPKSAAHLVRKRYYALANRLDGVEMPSDLDLYVLESGNSSSRIV